MVAIIKALVSVITSVLCVLGTLGAGGSFMADYSPKHANECKANFAVLSDIHMTDSSVRQFMVEMALCDMENAKTPLDALILSGDMTNMANAIEYERLENAFAKYTPAKNILMAVGNHDTWNEEVDDDDRFPESERLFIEYNKKIADRDIDKVYYSTQINGYSFIVMGSEYDHTDAYFSDTQLAWLEAEMAAAAESGKPIFVISHWPLKATHGLPNTWVGLPADSEVDEDDLDDGHMGNQSDAVYAILSKYENVFLISGHIHNGISNSVDSTIYGYATVEDVNGITSVNLPTYMNMSFRGTISAGLGLQFEVYNHKVLIRTRSFSAGVWYTANEYEIPLT